ncbi:low-density lipoprotein receptor-related protein 4-like isoform X1 [Rhopilema esculentum]|uniref:low-density lipoprotein receptor-related protein 4-like isoform X1 n=1 Tax=Rhopilema esculentum TaxID=499914 RepID=UPI0031D99725
MPSKCKDGQWKCLNSSSCIPVSWKCDGRVDCSNGTDEYNCGKTTCPLNNFTCKDGTCIPKRWRCDGDPDCGDNSDEESCKVSTKETKQCNDNEWKCLNSSDCIHVSWKCDGNADCPYGTDESDCAVNECLKDNGGCMHECVDLKTGYNCSCKDGFQLSSDGHSCDNIGECAKYGTCHQVCIQRGASHECSCANGYELEEDRKSCKANGTFVPRLIISSRYDIRNAEMNGKDKRLVVSGLRGGSGLDIDVASGYIYWSELIGETISRARIDGKGGFEVVLKGIGDPQGLAIDWIGRKIYWTDEKVKIVAVSEMHGGNKMDLVALASTSEPRAIACHPISGYLYWTDWGKEAGIERISMDGELATREKVISKDIGWPNGLTLDIAQNKMYWVDAKLKRLEVANLDGSGRKIIGNYIDFPFAIAHFENYLYWSNWRTHSVHKVDKFKSPGSSSQILRTDAQPMVVKVYHPLKQPAGNNPCGKNNGGCSHLCLIAQKQNGTGFSCKCPNGFHLKPNGKTCKVVARPKPADTNECLEDNGGCMHECVDLKTGYNCSCKDGFQLNSDGHSCDITVAPRLIFSNRNEIKSAAIKATDHRRVAGGSQGAVGLDLDIGNNYVYWCDLRLGTINKARVDLGNETEVIARDLGSPLTLTIDWIGRKIYWTNNGVKKIGVSEMDGTSNMDLVHLTAGSKPRAIACDPKNGYLYWTDWGKEAGIERISMDGELATREKVISKDIVWPNGLTLDNAQNKMYWVDAKFKRLEVANLDGSERKILTNSLKFPFALTHFEQEIFFTDWQQRSVQVISKTKPSHSLSQLFRTRYTPMDIKVYHPSRQPFGNNPCGNNNGGCSHLCLIAKMQNGTGFSCKCPNGFHITPNGKTCKVIAAARLAMQTRAFESQRK